MTLCDFDNARLTCPACGYRAKSLPTYRECRPLPTREWRPVMVGDAVATALAAVGITKQRIVWLRRLLRLPADCGCDARRHWLNAAGAAAQRWAADRLHALGHFYLGH